MELFLLRHGHANAYAQSDAQRELSDRGREEVRSTIIAAQAALALLDAVWVSPYLRAQQTWHEASALLQDGNPVVTTDPTIAPDGQAASVITQLERSGASRLLLVTHQPFVGDLLETLCGCESGRYFMGTANLACISLPLVASGLGELQWLKQPNL